MIDRSNSKNVDLRDIRVIPKLGGTVEDTELIEGLVLTQKTVTGPGGGLRRVEKAKIGLIQFCLSPPKTDMENQVVLSDYTQMDRVLREERQYTLNLVKQIKKAGCNVLLIQKSILRDALSDLALHFLNKMKILVVKDIEREDIEFVCKSTGCKPIASIDHFNADMLATAELVEEVNVGTGRVVKVKKIVFFKLRTLVVKLIDSIHLCNGSQHLFRTTAIVRISYSKSLSIALGMQINFHFLIIISILMIFNSVFVGKTFINA